MNRELKKYIYIIGTVCVMFLVVSLIFKVLPWLLVGGFITYIIMKIVSFIRGKSGEQGKSEFDTSKGNEADYSITDSYTNGEVIDVEYEDVDNKKD